jgi:integrase
MKFFVAQFGDKELRTFNAQDLERYKAFRKKSEVSNTTINIDIRTIKAAFAVALSWKRIAENPFSHAKQLKIDQQTKRVLSKEEFMKILTAIKEKWLYDIVAFNVLTGLRLGEIMNLKWSDYDPTKRQITVQSSKDYRVKGGKMRVIPVGDEAAALLENKTKACEWIFVGEKKKKYTNDYVSRKFKEYAQMAGLPQELHYHRLRDTYCTWLAEQNVPIHIIKALAGHSSVSVTEKYIVPNQDVMKQQVAKIKLPQSVDETESRHNDV